MSDWLVIVVVIACAILVLIPIVMIGHAVFGIAMAYSEHLRAERRRITVDLPPLGRFSTTDRRFWTSEVRGVDVTLESVGRPPSEHQSKQAEYLLGSLQELAERARQYLADCHDSAFTNCDVRKLMPFSIDISADGTFLLSLAHADEDGWHNVKFCNGSPVAADYVH